MKIFKGILFVIIVVAMLYITAYGASFTATDAAKAYNSENDTNLDVNKDGVINKSDAELILKKVLNDDYTIVTEKTTEATTEEFSKVPEEFEVTTYVDTYDGLNSAIKALAGKGKSAAIYVTDDLDCSYQLSLATSNAGVSIIGVQKADGAYPSLDFTTFRDKQSKISKDSQTGIYISGSGYNFKNLIIEKAPDCGFRIKGDKAGGCILENLIIRYNNNSGISITKGASNNTIRSCDIYRNCDLVQSLGSDADGVSIKLDSGENNINYNVRVWENGDDGWDSFGGHGYIAYVECMCFHNGDADIFTGKYDYDNYQPLDKNLLYVQALIKADPDFETKYNNHTITEWPNVKVKLLGMERSGNDITNYWCGNPNGFKFGSWSSNSNCDGYVDVDTKRYMRNCLAFGHGAKGFDQNNSKATIELKNTVGFDNGFKAGKPNYMMDKMTATKFENAISFDGNVEDLLPLNSKGVSGKFAVITPEEEVQREIRNKVDETFNKIVDAVSKNKILGEVFFDIYNY